MGLRLNASKSNLLVISWKRKTPQLSLAFDECPIQQVKSITYLGIHMILATHIDAVCSKAKGYCIVTSTQQDPKS